MSISVPRRLYEIDLLRFVAALSVVAYHYGFRAWNAHGIELAHMDGAGEYFRYGYLGVELFFMISGFVILLTAEKHDHRDFVRSRVIRLYPAYWIAVSMTTIVLAVWGSGKFQVTFPQYLANMTMLHKYFGIAHVDHVYWTLMAEFKFYVLVYLLLRFNQREHLRRWVSLWLLTGLLAYVGPEYLSDKLNSLFVSRWAPFFSVGIASYLLHRETERRWHDWLLWFVSGALCTAMAVTKSASLTDEYVSGFNPLIVGSIVAGCALLFAAIALDWSRIFRFGWLEILGVTTYPLYLLHAYIGYTILRQLDQGVARPELVALLAAVVIASAWLLHQWGEKPLARWLSARYPRSSTPE